MIALIPDTHPNDNMNHVLLECAVDNTWHWEDAGAKGLFGRKDSLPTPPRRPHPRPSQPNRSWDMVQTFGPAPPAEGRVRAPRWAGRGAWKRATQPRQRLRGGYHIYHIHHICHMYHIYHI